MPACDKSAPTIVYAAPHRLRRNAASYALLLLITLVAAYLRLHFIDSKSLWMDEGYTIEFIRMDWSSFVRILWAREANMALYYVLMRALAHANDSVAMLRGLSVLFSVATVPALYLLGRRLLGSGTGLVAALLLACNAYSVRYAQEARSYSLVTLLVILATYYFVRAVEDGHRRDWWRYITASVLAMYAHFFAVLAVVAHWATLESPNLFHCNYARPHYAVQDFHRAVVRIGVGTLPIWAFIVTTGPAPIAWIQRPDIHSLQEFFMQFCGNAAGVSRMHYGDLPWIRLFYVSMCPLYLALALLGAGRAVYSRFVSSKHWLQCLPLYWLLLPLAITFGFSLLLWPVFHTRYLSVSLPALVLMVASGVMSFRHSWLRLVVLAVVCFFAICGVQAYYKTDFDLWREDIRGATDYVLSRAQADDGVLLRNLSELSLFEYYADHARPDARPSILSPMAGMDDVAQDYRRIWIVVPLNPQGEEDQQSGFVREHLAITHHITSKREFKRIHVYVYERGNA